MREAILIFLGGGLGALARFAVSKGICARFFTSVPLGTLTANVTGSLLMGFFFSILNASLLPSGYRALITVGFIGAYTTFSTYALETVALLQRKEYGAAFLNFVLNNAASLAAIIVGMLLSNMLMSAIRGR